MKKALTLALASLVLMATVATQAHAYPVGSLVYGVFGKGRSAKVEVGYVRINGSSNSKVDWNSCSRCTVWAPTGNLYTSRSSAESFQRRLRRDGLKKTVKTAAVVAGVGYALWQIFKKR